MNFLLSTPVIPGLGVRILEAGVSIDNPNACAVGGYSQVTRGKLFEEGSLKEVRYTARGYL